MELTALGLSGAMLAAAVVVLIAARRVAGRGYARRRHHRGQLSHAGPAAPARVREAGRIREDLIASVSHEFRTPLTAIRGSAATLSARGDRITPEAREVLLTGIVEHADRLGRLLEDMLLAASAGAAPARGSVADVTTALRGFELGPPGAPVVLDIEDGLAAYVDGGTLDQVVRALADHARADARRDRPVTLSAHRREGEVVVELTYAGTGSQLSELSELSKLFEPFGSREAAATGRRATLALYVVRRLVEAHGGRAAAGRDGDRLRVRVVLPAPEPAAVGTPVRARSRTP